MCEQFDAGCCWFTGLLGADWEMSVLSLELDGEHSLRMIIGTKDIKIARATDGRRPLTTPIITSGILFNHSSQE